MEAPPTPPPLPPTQVSNEKASLSLKVRSAPPGRAFGGHVTEPYWDWFTPPTGKYFFYGTLQDPTILSEVIDSSTTPTLKPAQIIGYELKLWGQYPAVVDKQDGVVEGSVFEVLDEAAAEKLAYYETNNYRPEPCNIYYKDGSQKTGYLFKFCWDPNDLSEGSFNLDTWLKCMKRK